MWAERNSEYLRENIGEWYEKMETYLRVDKSESAMAVFCGERMDVAFVLVERFP